jgi:hypothetical protein
MTGEGKSFNIKDRRLFTADGRLRSEEEDAPAEASPAPPQPAAPATASPFEPEAAEQVDFARFLISLGAQALEALQARPPALAQVRTMVAVLEMLRDKSEGRRTAEEDEVLEALLYQLRLGYVERSKTERA